MLNFTIDTLILLVKILAKGGWAIAPFAPPPPQPTFADSVVGEVSTASACMEQYSGHDAYLQLPSQRSSPTVMTFDPKF